MEKGKKMTATRRILEKRRKLIHTYYNAWYEYMPIRLGKNKQEPYVIIAKHELGEERYFVLLSKNNKVYLVRIVSVDEHLNGNLEKISRASNKYFWHSKIFDTWINEAKEELKKEKQDFFNEERKKHQQLAVRKTLHSEEGVESYKFMAKHEYKGNYFFVMRSNSNEFIVTKVIWFAFPKLILLTDKEFEKYKELFEFWIKEASQKPKKKKENI